MNGVYIVAEAGVNHNGDPSLAYQLIDSAAESGANAVKFQTFKTESLVTTDAIKAKYQQDTTDRDESQFSMLKKLELSHATHRKLFEYCNKKNIDFLSTAFDLESLDFLVNDLGLNTLKVSSGDITNGVLLLAHARTRCDLIISTGMATLSEVEQALGVIAFGLIHGNNLDTPPSRTAFQLAYISHKGRQLLKKNVTLLHCTTEYPAPLEDIDLNSMATLKNTFGLRTGYSDHTEGMIVSIAASAMGAILIEKHFTLDKNMPGPDHLVSLDPSELKEMVLAIRTVEKITGDGIKGPKPSELKNIPIARKSLVSVSTIQKGDLFTEDNLTVKRPGTGRSPMEYWDLLGTKCQYNYEADEVIR